MSLVKAVSVAISRGENKGKTIVLGLVSSKLGELEPKDAIKRRIESDNLHLVRLAWADPHGAALTGPEEAALTGERSAQLLRAVNQLRVEDRLVIAYRYWFDLGEAEMAEALKVARGTVKSRLSRALRRLRAGLEGDTGLPPVGEGSGRDA